MRYPVAVELRRGEGWWLSALLTVAGTVVALRSVYWHPIVWAASVTAIGTAVEVMGPLAAAVAAYAGGRSRRRRMAHLEQLSDGGTERAATAQLAGLLAWVLVGYHLVVALVYVPTFVSATWGGPDLARTVAGGTALAFDVTVGYFCGRVWRSRLAAPVVAALAYVAIIIGQTMPAIRSIHLLLPTNNDVYDEFNTPNDTTCWSQALWLAAFAAAIFLAWRAAHLMMRRRGLPILALAIAAASVGGLGIASQDSRSNISAVTVAFTCSGDNPVICLHPAFLSTRPAVDAVLDPIAQRLAGTPFQVQRFEQRPRGVGGVPSPGAVAFALDDNRQGSIRLAAQEATVNALALSNSCFTDTGIKPGYDYAQLVASSIAGQPSTFIATSPDEQHARTRFDSLTSAARRTFLTRRAAAIRACNLSAADFA